jgi:hypothetical protein
MGYLGAAPTGEQVEEEEGGYEGRLSGREVIERFGDKQFAPMMTYITELLQEKDKRLAMLEAEIARLKGELERRGG